MNAPRAYRGRVSMLVPVYNGPGTLGAAIESCLAQDHPDFEVIAVDDGSTDPAVAGVLDAFAGRIRLVRQANGGIAAARNAGVAQATGEFIALMDGDDIAEPSRLRVQAAALEAHPDLVLVSTEFSAFDAVRGPYDRAHSARYYDAITRCGGHAGLYPEERRIPGHDARLRAGRIYDRVALGNFVHPPTIMVRRSAFARTGPFDTTLRHTSDWDWIVRAAGLGAAGFIEAPLLRYRRSATQMSHRPGDPDVPLEILRVLRGAASRDPALAARNAFEFRRRVTRVRIDAADGLAERDRARALALLARSLAPGFDATAWGRAFAKTLLPRGVVRRIRLARGTAAAHPTS